MRADLPLHMCFPTAGLAPSTDSMLTQQVTSQQTRAPTPPRRKTLRARPLRPPSTTRLRSGDRSLTSSSRWNPTMMISLAMSHRPPMRSPAVQDRRGGSMLTQLRVSTMTHC